MSHFIPLTFNSIELPAAYAQSIDCTRRALHARLADAPASEMLRQYFERGKMLRAFLVFASAASVGANPEDVAMAAEAIELMHGASLFHDDIIDQAAQRRGLASLHERLGVGRALVVGDDLLLRAFSALNETPSCPAPRLIQAMEVLNRLARECCRGQFDELCADRWISEERYLAIVSAKTAAPFVAAGVLGVLLGGGSETQMDQIHTYARHLGIAFQINDDLLDLTGEECRLGKPVGNSLSHGRPLLPLIYLWQLSSDATRKDLRQLGQDSSARAELVGMLEQNGIVDRVRQVQQFYIDAALRALEGFDDGAGVDALRALVTHGRAPDRLGKASGSPGA
jgi:geranylgeranyl pyrophosphate synthase